MQPDNSDSEHGLPHVGQNVALGLYCFAMVYLSGFKMAASARFELAKPVTGFVVFKTTGLGH